MPDVARTSGGELVLLRADDLDTVHVDHAFGQPGVLALERLGVHDGPFYEWRGRSMAAHDGSVHTRLRSTVVRRSPRCGLSACERRWANTHGRLLASARRQESFDVVTDYAGDLPLWLICEFLGLPVDAREEIATFLEGTESGFTDPLTPEKRQVAEDGIVALGRFVGGLIAERETAPQEDLVSDLLDAEREGRLDRDELVALVVNVLGGAVGSSRAAIANSVLLLVGHPEQAAWVSADPESRLTPAIEECLRFHPPFRSGRKLVLADNEVFGVSLRAGDTVFLARQAANRDPGTLVGPRPLRRDARPRTSLLVRLRRALLPGAGARATRRAGERARVPGRPAERTPAHADAEARALHPRRTARGAPCRDLSE